MRKLVLALALMLVSLAVVPRPAAGDECAPVCRLWQQGEPAYCLQYESVPDPTLTFISPNTLTVGSPDTVVTFVGTSWNSDTEVRVVLGGVDIGASFGAGTTAPPTVRNIVIPTSALSASGTFTFELLVSRCGSYIRTNALPFYVVP